MFLPQIVMVMLRTVEWPAIVMSYQKVDDTTPSALAMRNVKVSSVI